MFYSLLNVACVDEIFSVWTGGKKSGFCCCWRKYSVGVSSSWLSVILNSSVSLLIFCVLILPNTHREVFNSDDRTTESSSVFPYSSTSFCPICFDALLLAAYILRIVLSWRIDLIIIVDCSPVFDNVQSPRVHFVWN